MMLMFNIIPKKEKYLKHNHEKLKSLKHKILSNGEHVTTCLLCPYVFPVEACHYSMPPKKGCRISFQLNFEKRRGIDCPDVPSRVIARVLHDHEDPLINQLQYMTALTLRKAHHNKNDKGSVSAIGCKSNWHNFQ